MVGPRHEWLPFRLIQKPLRCRIRFQNSTDAVCEAPLPYIIAMAPTLPHHRFSCCPSSYQLCLPSLRIQPRSFSYTCLQANLTERKHTVYSCEHCEVYIASMRLRVPAGPPSWFLAVAEAMEVKELQHYMTIVQPSSGGMSTIFDFQPQNPDDIIVALAILSRQTIPALVEFLTGKKLKLSQLASMTRNKNAHSFSLE
ncbi:hypothetical protein O6H91_20G004800 [Diphasiastrum complanatum]|uniref:Uncharacterized protein n=1 Tax=Diphasiastrum complanatum TaxID=34168 RepID=A0ACC2AMD6_DIPCM|nr:hypothetical protein O6H91_20G004800 [Diphasiastrum complanatum]